MSLTVAQVRQSVAALVEAVASPIAFHESRWDLVSGAEPQSEGEGAFACIAGTTKFASEVEASRRTGRTEGVVQTSLAVRWLFALRAESYVSDFDAGLAAEAAAYKAITAASGATGLRLSVLQMSREVVGDGTWLRGEIQLRADHSLALS